MKKSFIKILSIIALVGIFALQADSAVTPTYVPRSQGRDKTRQVVGNVGHTHLYDMESWYGMGSVMLEYTQSFRPSRIARCLFGDDLTTGTAVTCNPCDPCDSSKSCDTSCNVIKIQGSRVSSRDAKAWLADYFYLPSDFSGNIAFSPKIQNVNVDFDFYVGLDGWANGLYFRMYGPITWTKWDLNFCETVDNAGTNSHPEGYFAPSCISNAVLLKSFESYVTGNQIASCDSITFQPLKYAKMRTCGKSRVGFADLRAELGWDFLNSEDYHLGLNIQGAAPTGTKRHAEFAFDPVVGNGHHWELGGGATGHYTLWKNEDGNKSFSFHADVNITHLFNAHEERTFDLKNKPNSRYMLAAKFTKTIISGPLTVRDDNINATSTTVVPAQFALEYAPVANLTTLNVKTNVAVQADIVAWLNLSVRGFSWDLGYNFWARSCEKIECPTTCDLTGCNPISLCNANQLWGLKGDARMFGFAQAAGGGLVINQAVALSATESSATIHAGTNVPGALDTASNDFYERNFSVDNAKFARAGTTLVFAPFLPGVTAISSQIKTSAVPVLLTCDDIDLCERSRGISHKIFTHLNYTWERNRYHPYLGLGGFVEFGQSHSNCDSSTACTTNCSSTTSSTSSCLTCSLSQWGIWGKLGISYN